MNHGNLLNDFSPAVNPPAEVEDVNDRKPEDWDEREKVLEIQKYILKYLTPPVASKIQLIADFRRTLDL